MSFSLVIVESPAKIKSFEKYLGSGYKCAASYGHIRELSGLSSIDKSANYLPKFINSRSKYKQINELKVLAAKASSVILATDDDREGEAIAWHLCKVLSLPIETTPRLIFHEITQSALTKAIQSPTTIDMNKVHAQQARQILDILVGFQISPILWKFVGGKVPLSAGRCQTPALRLVYDNQMEIDQRPGEEIYSIKGSFGKQGLLATLDKEFSTPDKCEDFLVESVNFKHTLSIKYKEGILQAPPKPFTTSSLQQTASSQLRYSPKKTMLICQKLYEAGKITYMRTDSRTYSKDFLDVTSKFISKMYGDNYVNKNISMLSGRKTKKDDNAQMAHEAIRPTDITCDKLATEKFEAEDHKMYKLIWNNTIESCMSDCELNQCNFKITAPEDGNYNGKEEEIVFLGWRVIEGGIIENMSYRYLFQRLGKKIVVSYNKLESKLGIKNTKQHYTEARLVQLLEEQGIGRPSTYSSLIEKIQTRGYVKKQDVVGREIEGIEFTLIDENLEENVITKIVGGEKNKLVMQPLGKAVWEYLAVPFESLFKYEYTKKMENDLDMISNGEKIWQSLCMECDNEVCDAIERIKDIPVAERNKSGIFGGENIKINDEYTYTITRYGPTVYKIVDGKKEYKMARKDLDIDKIKKGCYKIDEIIDQNSLINGKILGIYEGDEIILKKGKYGLYVVYKGENHSIGFMGKNMKDVTYIRVVEYLKKKMEEDDKKPKIREIDENVSIRVGQYGPYVYVKSNKLAKKNSKPIFYNLKGFDEDALVCDIDVLKVWLNVKYKLW